MGVMIMRIEQKRSDFLVLKIFMVVVFSFILIYLLLSKIPVEEKSRPINQDYPVLVSLKSLGVEPEYVQMLDVSESSRETTYNLLLSNYPGYTDGTSPGEVYIHIMYSIYVDEETAIRQMERNMIDMDGIVAKARCKQCVILNSASKDEIRSRYVQMNEVEWDCDEVYSMFKMEDYPNTSTLINYVVLRLDNRVCYLVIPKQLNFTSDFIEEIKNLFVLNEFN